jgi:hypothetical protein
MTNREAWIGLVAWSMGAGMHPKVVYAALVARQSSQRSRSFQDLPLGSAIDGRNHVLSNRHCLKLVAISRAVAESDS